MDPVELVDLVDLVELVHHLELSLIFDMCRWHPCGMYRFCMPSSAVMHLASTLPTLRSFLL